MGGGGGGGGGMVTFLTPFKPHPIAGTCAILIWGGAPYPPRVCVLMHTPSSVPPQS